MSEPLPRWCHVCDDWAKEWSSDEADVCSLHEQEAAYAALGRMVVEEREALRMLEAEVVIQTVKDGVEVTRSRARILRILSAADALAEEEADGAA